MTSLLAHAFACTWWGVLRRQLFNAEIIELCVRWYITCRLNYRGRNRRPVRSSRRWSRLLLNGCDN